MRVQNGHLVLGHYRGAPIRVHWSMPLGAIVLTGFDFEPGAWLGFLILVLVHELGHALVASVLGCRVHSIDAHAVGGGCAISGAASLKQRSMIAWGGVLGQLAVLLLVPLLYAILPSWPIFRQLLSALTTTNLFLIGLNLLPFRPLDGADAWKLFRR